MAGEKEKVRITKIEEAGICDVYNMEVEDIHDYAIANGVISHNCYDESRYVLMENPITPRPNMKKQTPLDDPLNLYTKKKPKYSYINI